MVGFRDSVTGTSSELMIEHEDLVDVCPKKRREEDVNEGPFVDENLSLNHSR